MNYQYERKKKMSTYFHYHDFYATKIIHFCCHELLFCVQMIITTLTWKSRYEKKSIICT